MQSKESHETESGTYGDCVEPVTEQDALEKGAEVVDTSCLDRWEACEACQELLRDFKGGKKRPCLKLLLTRLLVSYTLWRFCLFVCLDPECEASSYVMVKAIW
ncbi:hypothetical protein F2Q68_00007435 [Brassica cretica]|uniref:Uncharacterized protein n=1 Tax=Brassica cretica TaxID=69181 RepID=A0A8S9L2C5_BRACR|nr:hypothetical protein F2Q68_00007435 [Brassica cretica]